MDFKETEEERMIAETSREIAGEFGPDYWREHEEEEKFGQEFWDTLVDNNFTGILVPEKYEFTNPLEGRNAPESNISSR